MKTNFEEKIEICKSCKSNKESLFLLSIDYLRSHLFFISLFIQIICVVLELTRLISFNLFLIYSFINLINFYLSFILRKERVFGFQLALIAGIPHLSFIAITGFSFNLLLTLFINSSVIWLIIYIVYRIKYRSHWAISNYEYKKL